MVSPGFREEGGGGVREGGGGGGEKGSRVVASDITHDSEAPILV